MMKEESSWDQALTENSNIMFYGKETLREGKRELTIYRICDKYPPYDCVIMKGKL